MPNLNPKQFAPHIYNLGKQQFGDVGTSMADELAKHAGRPLTEREARTAGKLDNAHANLYLKMRQVNPNV